MKEWLPFNAAGNQTNSSVNNQLSSSRFARFAALPLKVVRSPNLYYRLALDALYDLDQFKDGIKLPALSAASICLESRQSIIVTAYVLSALHYTARAYKNSYIGDPVP